jgi:hypothetical protein
MNESTGEIKPESKIPKLQAEQVELIGALHETISKIESRLQPVSRQEPAKDPSPTSPPPTPSATVYGKIEFNNEEINCAIQRLRKITGLLEV